MQVWIFGVLLSMRTEQDKLKFIAENWENYSQSELQKLLGFKSRTSIINRFKQLGIRKGNRKGDLSKLLEENLLSYYWIGFILADGHLSSTNQLVVSLANEDKGHLEKLAFFLKGSVKECKRTKSPGSYVGSEPTYQRLAIQDKTLGLQIKNKFNISNRKTYNPPNNLEHLPNDFLLAIIVGFIDGDGSITTQNYIKIECHNSWKKVLSLFKDVLEKNTNISINESKEGRKYCYIQLKKDIFKFMKNFAIKHQLPILTRKWYHTAR